MIMEWENDAKELYEELLKLIPVFARPMAKKGIERRILEISDNKISMDEVIRGYVMAAPGNMKGRVIDVLKAKNIDLTPYKDIMG
ncbi:DUF2621 family protein [Cytobacillus sp. Hm23]